MTEPENFLERWSRRKRETADETAAVPQAKPEHKEEAAAPAEKPAAKSSEPIDIADLPPIESIAAETDVRVFLQQGVPPALTREALRRAWSSDPAIRDFVGLVENGWDFNDPNAMAGFGPMAAGDVARLLTQVIGTPEQAKPAESPPATAHDETEQHKTLPAAGESGVPSPPVESAAKDNEAALQRSTDAASRNESHSEIGGPTHSIVKEKRGL